MRATAIQPAFEGRICTSGAMLTLLLRRTAGLALPVAAILFCVLVYGIRIYGTFRAGAGWSGWVVWGCGGARMM